MKLRIEIDKRRGRNIHIVLRGIAGDGAGIDGSAVFAGYVEVCKAFRDRQDQPNAVDFDVVKAGDRPLAAYAV